MKKLIEVKRGDAVPDNAKLVKENCKQTKEQPSQGGFELVTWDLWEVPTEDKKPPSIEGSSLVFGGMAFR